MIRIQIIDNRFFYETKYGLYEILLYAKDDGTITWRYAND